MSFSIKSISQSGASKDGGELKCVTADPLATVEGAGYFNSLAVDDAVPQVGTLVHIDTLLKKVTLYAYSHNGATFTLATAGKEVLL